MEYNLVKEVSQGLSNFLYEGNIQATKEVMDLFDKISKTELSSADDYINLYDNNFYTYQTFDALVLSEEEQTDGLTKDEIIGQMNISIWRLPCGWYVQYV